VKGHKIFDSLASFPYLIPGTCWGIGYILAFNHEPLRLTGTAFIVIVNMIFKQLPTTTKICSAALTQIPHSLERAARDMGGGQGAVLKDVIIPNMKPAFFSCFSYHFSSSMTSAGAILFLINPAKKLAVFQLFDAVSSGDYANASLIATLIILIVVCAEGIVHLITGKEQR
jgi:iron(III) transport system permease protein